jgi:hypothetical protein
MEVGLRVRAARSRAPAGTNPYDPSPRRAMAAPTGFGGLRRDRHARRLPRSHSELQLEPDLDETGCQDLFRLRPRRERIAHGEHGARIERVVQEATPCLCHVRAVIARPGVPIRPSGSRKKREPWTPDIPSKEKPSPAARGQVMTRGECLPRRQMLHLPPDPEQEDEHGHVPCGAQ